MPASCIKELPPISRRSFPLSAAPWELKPTGTAFSNARRSFFSRPSTSSRVRLVLTALTPQPMSTPTADGQIALVEPITVPMVAPTPRCTSGMTRSSSTHGSAPTSRICLTAEDSTSHSLAHMSVRALAPGSSTGKMLSVIFVLHEFYDGLGTEIDRVVDQDVAVLVDVDRVDGVHPRTLYASVSIVPDGGLGRLVLVAVPRGSNRAPYVLDAKVFREEFVPAHGLYVQSSMSISERPARLVRMTSTNSSSRPPIPEPIRGKA